MVFRLVVLNDLTTIFSILVIKWASCMTPSFAKRVGLEPFERIGIHTCLPNATEILLSTFIFKPNF